MIEEARSSAIADVDTFCERLDVSLFPEEEAQLGHAADKRRRELAAGRGCARDAVAVSPPAAGWPGTG
jgi:4'-phosphopantetheinyl transferase EntD